MSHLIAECQSLILPNSPFLTNAANFAAWIFHQFEDINWAGFYLARSEGLWLGPFQGKPACTFIEFGKGVCGTAALQRSVLVVPDVRTFPGHIVCDPISLSEAVFPLVKGNTLWGVFDLDSPKLNRFAALTPTLQQLIRIFVDRTTMDLPFGIPCDSISTTNGHTNAEG